MNLVCWLLQIYIIICVVRVLMSWIPDLASNGVLSAIGTLSYTLTEPLFAAVRRSIPRMGDIPIDFSPAIVILGISLLRQIVCSL